MKIQKISKYVPISTASRSSSGESTIRHMLVSLPRIKWLEKNPDPTMFTSAYHLGEDDVDLKNFNSYNTLTKREKELLRMRDELNMTTDAISKSKKMNIAVVHHILYSAAKKLAYRNVESENIDARASENLLDE